MAFKDSVKIDKAFKNLLGYAYSEEEKYYWEEGIFWALSVASEDIWADSSLIVYDDPDASVAAGVAQKLDHYVMTPNSSAFYNGKDRAWTIRETPGDENSQLLTGFIPHVRYGNAYMFQLYDYNDNLITVPQMIEHGIIFDYSNGVVVLNNDSNYSFQTPFKITVWKYTGRFGAATASGTCTPDSIVVADIDWISLEPSAPQNYVSLCVVDDDDNIVYTECGGFSGGGSSSPPTQSGTGGSSTFLGLSDTPSSYAGSENKLVKVKSGADGLDFGDLNFTELADTPSDYTGNSGKVVSVNSTETGLTFSNSSQLVDYVVTTEQELRDALSDCPEYSTIGIKGRIVLTSKVVMPSKNGVTLVGLGNSTIIRPKGDYTFIWDTSLTMALSSLRLSNVRFRFYSGQMEQISSTRIRCITQDRPWNINEWQYYSIYFPSTDINLPRFKYTVASNTEDEIELTSPITQSILNYYFLRPNTSHAYLTFAGGYSRGVQIYVDGCSFVFNDGPAIYTDNQSGLQSSHFTANQFLGHFGFATIQGGVINNTTFINNLFLNPQRDDDAVDPQTALIYIDGDWTINSRFVQNNFQTYGNTKITYWFYYSDNSGSMSQVEFSNNFMNSFEVTGGYLIYLNNGGNVKRVRFIKDNFAHIANSITDFVHDYNGGATHGVIDGNYYFV